MLDTDDGHGRADRMTAPEMRIARLVRALRRWTEPRNASLDPSPTQTKERKRVYVCSRGNLVRSRACRTCVSSYCFSRPRCHESRAWATARRDRRRLASRRYEWPIGMHLKLDRLSQRSRLVANRRARRSASPVDEVMRAFALIARLTNTADRRSDRLRSCRSVVPRSKRRSLHPAIARRSLLRLHVRTEHLQQSARRSLRVHRRGKRRD